MANASIRKSTQFGAVLGLPAGDVPVVALADVNGNLIRTSDAGDGTSFLGGSQTLMALPRADYTDVVAANPTSMNTAGINYVALDLQVFSFTGGVTPSITFFLDRLDGNAAWFQVWTSSAQTAAFQWSVDLGPGLGLIASPSQAQHAVFTYTTRFRWVFGGGTPPTSVNFIASCVGI